MERAFLRDSPIFEARIMHLLDFLPKNTDKPILDAGCGNGFIIEFLKKRNCKNFEGFDIHEDGINYLKTKYPENKFEISDFENFKPRKKYDYIICTEVLEHLKNDDKAIKKIYKWLSKKGLAIISVPIMNYNKSNWIINRHYRHYKPREIIDKLKKYGFKINEYKIWGSWLRGLMVKIAGNESTANKKGKIMIKFYEFLKFIILPLTILESKISTKLRLRKEGIIIIARK